MNKKISCKILAIILVVGGMICVSQLFFKNDSINKYLIIQDELVFDDKYYVQLVENLAAIELEEQIGVTDQGQEVYKIKGQDSNDWICIRNDGGESIYRNRDIQFLTIDRFKTNKLVVKDDTLSGGERKTIIEEDIINKILSDLKDENLSNYPEGIEMSKKVILYSDSFPGLCFTLYYLHDSENGVCFLYDYGTDKLWMVGHELMQQLI